MSGEARNAASGDPATPQSVPSAWSRDVRAGLVCGIILLVLGALTLDGGQTMRGVAAAWLTQLVVMLALIWKRPFEPTKTDLWFARWGVLGIVFVTVVMRSFLI